MSSTTVFTSPTPYNSDETGVAPSPLGLLVEIVKSLFPDISTYKVPALAGYNTTTLPLQVSCGESRLFFVENNQATAIQVVGTAPGDPGQTVNAGCKDLLTSNEFGAVLPVVCTPATPPGGAAVHILEGWFVGLGEGEIIIEGGVGQNTPPTEMNRFSAPISGQAPNNQYSATEFVASVAGTITELQIACPHFGMGASIGQQIIGQVTLNGVLVGTPAILSSLLPAPRERVAVAQNIPYVAGDLITVSYSTVNNIVHERNGLLAQLRVQE